MGQQLVESDPGGNLVWSWDDPAVRTQGMDTLIVLDNLDPTVSSDDRDDPASAPSRAALEPVQLPRSRPSPLDSDPLGRHPPARERQRASSQLCPAWQKWQRPGRWRGNAVLSKQRQSADLLQTSCECSAIHAGDP